MHDVLAVYRLHNDNLSKKKIVQHVNVLQTWGEANVDRKKLNGTVKFI